MYTGSIQWEKDKNSESKEHRMIEQGHYINGRCLENLGTQSNFFFLI